MSLKSLKNDQKVLRCVVNKLLAEIDAALLTDEDVQTKLKVMSKKAADLKKIDEKLAVALYSELYLKEEAILNNKSVAEAIQKDVNQRLLRHDLASTEVDSSIVETLKVKPDSTYIASTSALVNLDQLCLFCNNQHKSKDCPEAMKMSLDERRAFIMKSSSCSLCLSTNHGAFTCISHIQCSSCQGRHLDMLCIRHQNETSKNEDSGQTNGQKDDRVSPPYPGDIIESNWIEKGRCVVCNACIEAGEALQHNCFYGSGVTNIGGYYYPIEGEEDNQGEEDNAVPETSGSTSNKLHWTDMETKFMLRSLRLYKTEVGPKKKFKTNKMMWAKIASNLTEEFPGREFDGLQVANKWKSLQRRRAKLLERKRKAESALGYDDDWHNLEAVYDSIEPEIQATLGGVDDMKPQKNARKRKIAMLLEKQSERREMEREERSKRRRQEATAKKKRHEEKMELFRKYLDVLKKNAGG